MLIRMVGSVWSVVLVLRWPSPVAAHDEFRIVGSIVAMDARPAS